MAIGVGYEHHVSKFGEGGRGGLKVPCIDCTAEESQPPNVFCCLAKQGGVHDEVMIRYVLWSILELLEENFDEGSWCLLDGHFFLISVEIGEVYGGVPRVDESDKFAGGAMGVAYAILVECL